MLHKRTKRILLCSIVLALLLNSLTVGAKATYDSESKKRGFKINSSLYDVTWKKMKSSSVYWADSAKNYTITSDLYSLANITTYVGYGKAKKKNKDGFYHDVIMLATEISPKTDQKILALSIDNTPMFSSPEALNITCKVSNINSLLDHYPKADSIPTKTYKLSSGIEFSPDNVSLSAKVDYDIVQKALTIRDKTDSSINQVSTTFDFHNNIDKDIKRYISGTTYHNQMYEYKTKRKKPSTLTVEYRYSFDIRTKKNAGGTSKYDPFNLSPENQVVKYDKDKKSRSNLKRTLKLDF